MSLLDNQQSIINYARAFGMPPNIAAYMAAQSQHETGNYSSRFYTVGNNAFGYSYLKGAKWQLDKGGPTADNGIPIAQYASVRDSVGELVDWIKRRQKEGKFPKDLTTISSPAKYASLLKDAGYYGAPLSLYSNALTRFFAALPDALKKGITTGSGAALLFLLVVGVSIYYFINKN